MNKYTIETLKLILIFLGAMMLAAAYNNANGQQQPGPVKPDSTSTRIIGRDTVITNHRTGIVFIRLEKRKNGK